MTRPPPLTRARGLPKAVLAVVLAVVVLCSLSGCSLLRPGEDERAGTELTAWQKVLDMAGPEGEAGKDMALAAFSLAYGGLPDAAVPEGEPHTPRSGSTAIRWIAGVWNELTDAQRSAVRDALGGDPGSVVSGQGTPASTARTTASTASTASATAATAAKQPCGKGRDPSPSLLAELSLYWTLLAKNIGLTGGFPDLVACTARKDRVNAAKDKVYADTTTWTGAKEPPTCVITFYPLAFASDVLVKETLVHELTHCAMRVVVGGKVPTGEIPAWVAEGLSEWAAGSLLNSGETLDWDAYLATAAIPLTKRSYDAVGFWFELTYLGIDVWSVFRSVVKQSVAGNRTNTTAAFAAALQGHEGTVLGGWPAGVLRLDSRSKPWNLDGPGIPPTVHKPEKFKVANGGPSRSAGSAAFGIAAVRFDVTADIVRFSADRPDIGGRLGLIDLSERTLPEALGDVYCTRGEACVCPKDSPHAGTQFARIPAGATLAAFTAGAHAATLTARPQSLEEFCGPEKSTPPPPPPPNPTPGSSGPAGPESVGTDCPNCTTGSTHGDPHLVTFDGAFYDLQAAGEFTLTASLDDSLLVQTRQQPLGDSTSFGVNTAAAANVAGDKVGFYLRPKSTAVEVRVNGKTATSAQGTTKLPKGGTLTRTGDGAPHYTLAWPDGSRLYVTPTSDDALKIDMAVPPARKGRLNGLLGDYDGSAANDLDAGGGSTLPATAPPYEDLHGVFADHWRIKQAKSLFDYAAGESTAAFTDRSFPSTRADAASLPGRAEAEKQCKAAGVSGPGPQFEACVLDVAVTGKREFAESAAAQQKFTASGHGTNPPGPAPPPGGPLVDPICLQGKDGPKTRSMVLGIGETVRVGGTGRLLCGGFLPAGDWRHHFLVSDKTARTVRFTHVGTADCGLQWTVYKAYVSATPVLPKVSVCQDLGTVDMQADTVYIVVVDKPDQAAEGRYGFTVT